MSIPRFVLGLGCWALCAACWTDAAGADWKDAAQKLMQATVSVEIESAGSPAETGADEPAADPQAVIASGTIISADGLIVTVDQADAPHATWRIRLPGAETYAYPAKTLVVDRRSGLRLLKVDAEDWKPLTVSQDETAVGQQVATLAVDQSRRVRFLRKREPRVLSVGIVSALERQVAGTFAPAIQADVRGSLGSAGSPLVDTEGRLVGIVVAAEGSEPEENVTLAVPAPYVAELLDFRRDDTTVVVHAAYLGVQLQTPEEGGGASVGQVFDNSPAAKSDLNVGDVIVAVNDVEVADAEDLASRIGRLAAGVQAKLTLRRDGKELQQVEVALGRREAAQVVSDARVRNLIDLGRPGQFRILPLDDDAVVDPNTLRAALAELMKKQQDAYAPKMSQQGPTLAPASEPPAALLPGGVSPLTIRVQRPDADRRLDQLAADVKALREDVQKLTEQLRIVAAKLESE